MTRVRNFPELSKDTGGVTFTLRHQTKPGGQIKESAEKEDNVGDETL